MLMVMILESAYHIKGKKKQSYKELLMDNTILLILEIIVIMMEVKVVFLLNSRPIKSNSDQEDGANHTTL